VIPREPGKVYLYDGVDGLTPPGWPRDREPEPPMRLSARAKARGAYTSCIRCAWLPTRCCATCPKAEPDRHVFVQGQPRPPRPRWWHRFTQKEN